MTTKLTIKDLHCGNCTRPIGKPGGTDDCPLSIPAHLDVAVVNCIEIIGCASHPLALQVLTGPVIEELERRNASSKKMNVGMLCTGVREGREEAIKLLKEGVKKP